MKFVKVTAAVALATLIGAGSAFAAEGAATGNGTSTPAGPAASGGMKKHHSPKMMKKKHGGAMKSGGM